MKVTVRLMGLDMSPDASSDGATVEHALKKLVSVAEMPWTVDDLMMHVMLVQNRRANKKDVLEDNDTLIVLKTLEGG
jgi:hypothetical protein